MAKLCNSEKFAKAVFIAFAAFSIFAVFAIVIFMLYASVPAFRQIGFFHFLFGTKWAPTMVEDGVLQPSEGFGILPMIVGSIALTVFSVVIGGTLAVFTAVFLVYYCPKWLKGAFVQVINLLAGIPSLVYGYFGFTLLMPLLEKTFGVTSGFGLLSSTLILSVMILPTIASVTKNSLESVPMNYYEGALALGCSKNQAVFKVCLPAAKNGIVAAVILGIGRAVGETMAVQLLVGNGEGFPNGFFVSFKTLTSNIVSEMGYAEQTLHKPALIATGFVLLLFILLINILLWFVKKNDKISGNRLFSRKLKENANAVSKLDYHKTGSAQDVLWVLSYVVAALVAAVLLFIVGFVLVKGISGMSWNFLFGKSGNKQTTLAPAFLSTGMLILMALLVALPLGIGAAIYLTEYAKKENAFVKIVRLFIDTLSGVPSVVFGLFGMIFFGTVCKMGYSLLNGSLTLALIILPTIIRSTEQSLSEVPDSMREASLALGASKVRTIFLVVLPQAISGIITSIILSIGRIVGESAALIYTAGAGPYMPKGYGSEGASFTVIMWMLNSEGTHVSECYATAAVLIIFVIILNLLVTLIEKFFRKKNAV